MPAIAPPLSEDEFDDVFEEAEEVVEEDDVVWVEPETVETRLDSDAGAVVGMGVIAVTEPVDA